MTKAFTLAEVLIVLGIIGLIADMTIPVLHQSIEEKVITVRLQKAYSTLESAYRLAVQENGTPDNWDINGGSKQKSIIIYNNLKPYLNILKYCENNDGCMASDYKTLAFNSFQSISDGMISFVLSDGTSFAMWTAPSECGGGVNGGLCSEIFIDINGLKPPNQYGHDFFAFLMLKDKGILPVGIPGNSYPFDTYCNKSINKSWETGRGCAAWVIFNGNTDYLHCNDLSWDGKKSCK